MDPQSTFVVKNSCSAMNRCVKIRQDHDSSADYVHFHVADACYDVQNRNRYVAILGLVCNQLQLFKQYDQYNMIRNDTQIK